MSLAERLISALNQIVEANDALMDASMIEYDPHATERMAQDGIFMAVPDGKWGPLDDKQRQLQRTALEHWTPWCEQVELLFSGDTNTTRRALAEASEKVLKWFHRSGRDYSVPATTREAKLIFRNHVEPFYKMLGSLARSIDRVLVVPDTNILLRFPDVTTYADAAGTGAYTVFLVPGVLAEMDQHKTNHRVPEVREKARKFGDRLKGWRNQGSLSRGVKVMREIFVQAEGQEPDFSKTLSWLDRSVSDDRILASILEIQRRFPTTGVLLLTGDTNMLVKADKANIPTAEPLDLQDESP